MCWLVERVERARSRREVVRVLVGEIVQSEERVRVRSMLFDCSVMRRRQVLIKTDTEHQIASCISSTIVDIRIRARQVLLRIW